MSKRRRHRHASSPGGATCRSRSCSVLVERAKAGALSETDCATLKSAVDTLASLTQELSAKGTTDRAAAQDAVRGEHGEDQSGHRRRHPHWWHCGPRWARRTQEPRVTVARTSRSDRGMAAMVRRRTLVHQDQGVAPLSARRDAWPECQKGKVTCFRIRRARALVAWRRCPPQ